MEKIHSAIIDTLNRVGIKGGLMPCGIEGVEVSQLEYRVSVLADCLRMVAPDFGEPEFPVEVYLRAEDLAEQLTQTGWLLCQIAMRPEVSRIQLHIPYYPGGVNFNLCVKEGSPNWQPTMDCLRTMLQLAQATAVIQGKPVTICIHGYHLPPSTPEKERDKELEKLGVDTKHCIQNLLYFSEDERKLLCLETMAYGPFTHAITLAVLAVVACETGCGVVLDASHLAAHYEWKGNQFVWKDYHDYLVLRKAIGTLLPHIKSWHICQRPKNTPKHRDDQLIYNGVVDWEMERIPILQSFQKNDAFAILEVGDARLELPFAMVGNNISFRGFLLEQLLVPQQEAE